MAMLAPIPRGEEEGRLRMLWNELIGSFCYNGEEAPEYSKFWIDRIVEQYTHPDRHYHTITHLLDALRHAWQIAGYQKDIRLVELGIFFHDFIYDPRRSDNEECSAEVAWKALSEMDFTDRVISPVRRYIEVTKTHKPMSWEEAVICDADTAILASSSETYWEYAEGVELEYFHLTEDEWLAGRSDWVSKMLEREELYNTEVMYQKTPMAKENLKRELDYLAVRMSRANV